MNIHNHSIWPPPGASDFNNPANAARRDALLQQSGCANPIVAMDRSSDDSAAPGIDLLDKG